LKRPAAEVLLAAILFGAGTPLAKSLLGTMDPIALAGLLYLGAGVGAGLVLAVRRHPIAIPRGKEAWILAGAVLAGGVAAPILMMAGLRSTPAATASLLLNFEAVATAWIASKVFGEAIGRRAWAATALVTGAACLLVWRADEPWGLSAGAAGIAAACALWGLDNNLTRLVHAADPLVIVGVKGLAAGSFSLVLGRILGANLPRPGIVAAAMLLGSVSYGLSIVLFVRALRELGAARTGALFGTAPFAGAILSWLLLREAPSAAVLAAFPLMAWGAFLLLTESHRHLHHHREMVHVHSHTHDDGHHDHAHEPGMVVVPGVPHTHPHRHAPRTHDHPHAPDLHHRHDHVS
jgi:drug/metabolite transporter (DMT)-like permease